MLYILCKRQIYIYIYIYMLFHHDFIQVQAKYNIIYTEDQVHRLNLDKWQVTIYI